MRTATFIDPGYRGTHFDADVLDANVRNVEQEAVALDREMEREAGAREEGVREAAQTATTTAVVPKHREGLAGELAIYKQEAVLAAEGDPLYW